MKQVFVAGSSFVTPQAAGSDQSFGTLAAGEVGIWANNDDSGQGDFFASALLQTAFEAGTAADASDVLTVAQGIPLKPLFQIVQGMPAGENPIASPIVNATNQLISVDYMPFTVSAKGTTALALDGMTPAVGDVVSFKINIRHIGDPSIYETQINPSTGSALGWHKNKVFNFEYEAGSATLDTEGAAMAAAINADGQLSKFMSAAYVSGTDDITLTALTEGTIIEIPNQSLENVTGDFFGTTIATTLVTNTGPIIGSGNYHQVISEEKQARYSQGNFNRMYFAPDYTSYVTSGETYDQIRILYRNNLSDNVFHGGNAGINELVIFWKDTAAGSTTWDTVFGFTADTASKIFVG